MRILDLIEKTKVVPNDGKYVMPPQPVGRGHTTAFIRNKQAMEDVVWTLNHTCPPPTRKGLAIMLADLSKYELEIQGRDALVRLAAWAIVCATKLDDRRTSYSDPLK